MEISVQGFASAIFSALHADLRNYLQKLLLM